MEQINFKQKIEKNFSNKPFMSQKTFCQTFPFHIVFDKQMYIKQCGTTIARLYPQMKQKDCKLTDIFTIIRPHINLEFQAICSQIMSVFVLSASVKTSKQLNEQSDEKDNATRFKGQMVYLSDKQMILFQCSPCLMSLEDLYS